MGFAQPQRDRELKLESSKDHLARWPPPRGGGIDRYSPHLRPWVRHPQDRANQTGRGRFAIAPGHPDDGAATEPHEQVHLGINRHTSCAGGDEIGGILAHGGARKHHVDVRKVLQLVPSQHKPHREPMQGRYRVLQLGSWFDIGDRHLRPLRHQIPRQSDRAPRKIPAP